MKTKRVFWIVLDSFGVGELPDAADFGDEGSNTLRACAESGKLNIPNMIKLGLGNIEGVDCIAEYFLNGVKLGESKKLLCPFHIKH